MKAQKQNRLMTPRCEYSDVRKIHILRHQETLLRLRRMPDVTVKFAGKPFFDRRLNVVADLIQNRNEAGCQVFVPLNFHRTCGVAGTGRSSSADAAAKAIAA